MSINYNIKADQILGILGYNQPAGEGFLNGFERENNVKLPLCLRNFYKVAYWASVILLLTVLIPGLGKSARRCNKMDYT